MSIIIRRAEIVSFGKLKNRVFECGEGIHIFEAPNESGKSTLAAFLKYVLYGFAGVRNQTIAENEKKLYTPWDGAPAEGTVWVKKGNTEYRITRKSSGAKDTLTVTDAATGKPVPEMQDAIPGVAIFGISEEVFARTLFFRQTDLPQSRDAVLADQLQNIAVSPEEQINSKKATDRLAKAKNELRARAMGGGILPKLEKEEADLRERLERANAAAEELSELRLDVRRQREMIAKNKIRSAEVAEEMDNLDRWDAKTELERLRSLDARVAEAEKEYASSAELIASRGEEDSAFLTGLLRRNGELERIRVSRAEKESELEKLDKDWEALSGGMSQQDADRLSKKLKELKIGQISFGALAAVFLAISIALFSVSKTAGIVLAVASLLALAALGVCFLLSRKTAKDAGAQGTKELRQMILAVPETERQRAELLSRKNAVFEQLVSDRQSESAVSEEIESGIRSYRVELGTDFSAQLQLLIDECQKIAKLDTRRKEAHGAYDAALGGREISAIAEKAEGAKEPERTRELADRERRYLNQQRELLSEQEKDKSVRLSAMEAKAEDPALLTGKLDAVTELIADGKKKYEAYDAARKGIEEASDLMKARIAPQIGERAGLYFRASTGGAYKSLEVNTEMELTAGDGGPSREADYLSAGTKDLAALSKRLALVDILYDGEGVPILMDDAFGRLDDSRLTATALMLGKAANHHQILILTCCDRERKAFDRAGVDYELRQSFDEAGNAQE